MCQHTRVCVFGALTLVGAFFIEGIMSKKKKKFEDIEKLLMESSEQINFKTNKELILSKTMMDIAENKLTETFDETQLALYEQFVKERKKFYEIAKKIYVKH